jgi:DMSO/TMAO reductase YedYZ heme-binding membrane subunit
VTALVTAPSAVPAASPLLRLDTDAAADRAVRLVSGLVLWLGLLLVTYWWDADGGIADLADWESGLTSLGRLSGLWAAQLLLLQVLLMSRLPPLEHAFGRDRLARIHRVIGFLSFYLMITHIVLIIAGYASGQWSAVLKTTWELITSYGGMLLAVAGTACLIMVVITSIRAARRRLRYESWHLLHLYGYLGVGLALPHQLWTGQEFLLSPAATLYWWTLWAAAAGAVVVWRVWLPVWRSARFQLRVAGVVRESSDVVSVYLTGRQLDPSRVRTDVSAAGPVPNQGWFSPAPVSASPHCARSPKDSSTRMVRRSSCSSIPPSRCSWMNFKRLPRSAVCRLCPCPAHGVRASRCWDLRLMACRS